LRQELVAVGVLSLVDLIAGRQPLTDVLPSFQPQTVIPIANRHSNRNDELP
jgi:hypothetical protein